MASPVTLTAQQIAMLAQGMTVEGVVLAGGTVPTTPNPAPNSPASPAAPVAPQSPAGAPTTPAAAPVADAVAVDKSVEQPALHVYLQAKLDASQEALVAAKGEASSLKTQLAQAEVASEGLLDIARKAVGNMSVALGGRADIAASMSASEVVAKEAELGEQFKSKFKVGTQSRPSAEVEDTTKTAAASETPFLDFLVSRVKG